jgi:sterol desaturase/sphingolipid hydroxylase (fatty acid hydroxylase superfamily)
MHILFAAIPRGHGGGITVAVRLPDTLQFRLPAAVAPVASAFPTLGVGLGVAAVLLLGLVALAVRRYRRPHLRHSRAYLGRSHEQHHRGDH